ncbi:hypothetical protein BDBG_01414 [Blastomyces gilchristii SLH14081]|uniref:CASTOR ACT domain-containing protein n=1 Tax=Blastomyces gilchristii (strain SLH14081) TaxID=559298 RepID=A0A179UCP7_BLAGS|nr:uncharacterized protein BDBG_01414 [Blastomyces gilchristii SLH14081]OAT04937.1 hypothetical protein BDBG_01414 [Blastomyces gilchristii SLH14081]
MSLFSAQVQFLNDCLALIHIPLDLYPFFLHPILQLIFHDVPPIEDIHPDELELRDLHISEPTNPAFLNISITPVECSIVCSRELADLYFRQLAEKFNKNEPSKAHQVSISEEDFIVMQVDGQGLDAGQRVLELTSALAMAGVSIFFISTYFSDYILVPRRSRGLVTHTIKNRGFNFEVPSDAFVNSSSNPQYRSSPPSLDAQRSPPLTPPPSTLPELQTRTFASLRKHNIHARVDKSLRIVQCAAQYSSSSRPCSPSILRPSLVTTLILDKPRFLSLTLTATDPAASILLEKRLLPRFSLDPISCVPPNKHGGYSRGDSDNNLLLGSQEDVLIPIMLDLHELPLEATGIVCGVASRLAAATQSREPTHAIGESDNDHDDNDDDDARSVELSTNGSTIAKFGYDKSSTSSQKPRQKSEQSQGAHEKLHRVPSDPDSLYPDAVDISFLSTVRAGTVIVGERELERAMASLDAESGPSSSL